MNADTIATGLSAFAPEQVAIAAGRIMLGRIHTLADERKSFAFETTLASLSFGPLLRQMKRRGYEVHVVFLWLPTAAMAVERVRGRVRGGGHSIPNAIVERRFERGLRNFFKVYRPIADSWIMLDNSAAPQPVPIAWRNVGGPIQIVKTGPWNSLRSRYEQTSSDS